MIPSHQQAKDMQDQARREQQADERIRELEDEVKGLRHQTERAYTMLDRYANEVSDEAYRWIELALTSALEGGDRS
jgi:uncharacterized protein (DUF305 family)